MFTAIIKNEERKIRNLEDLIVAHKECGDGEVRLKLKDRALIIECCDCGRKNTLREFSDFLVKPNRRVTVEGDGLMIVIPYELEPRRLVASGNGKKF